MRSNLDVGRAVARRSLRIAFTNPAIALPSIIFPVFFLVAFAGGLQKVGDVPGFRFDSGYTAWQFCFVFLQSAAFGGIFTGFGVAGDWESGFVRRILLAAPRRTGMLVGYAMSAAVRWMVSTTVITIGALIAGMNVGVYVPLDLLQGWIRSVAEWNPMTAIMNGTRGFIDGAPHQSALAFACAAGLLALLATWGLTGLRRAERGE